MYGNTLFNLSKCLFFSEIYLVLFTVTEFIFLQLKKASRSSLYVFFI